MRKITLKSKETQQEYEILALDRKEGEPKNRVIVQHKVLEDLFVKLAGTVTTNITPIFGGACAMIFSISDDKGKVVYGTGEATEKTLSRNFSKEYPTALSFQRAFDRAVIRYFDFEDVQMYSASEFVPQTEEDEAAVFVVQKTEPAPAIDPDILKDDDDLDLDVPNESPAPVVTEEEEVPPAQPIVPATKTRAKGKKPTSKSTPATSDKASTRQNYDPGNYRFKSGKYQDQTIQEVYKANPSYITFLADKGNSMAQKFLENNK